MKRRIQPGDRVQYRAEFLRSIGCFTGDIPQAKGIVTGLVRLGESTEIAFVEWGSDEVPEKVNSKNLQVIK